MEPSKETERKLTMARDLISEKQARDWNALIQAYENKHGIEVMVSAALYYAAALIGSADNEFFEAKLRKFFFDSLNDVKRVS